MKLFVTGATGFVGKPLIAAAMGRGDSIVAVSRNAARAKEALPGVEVVEGDIERPGPWQDAISGCDAIVHLAGESVAGKRWDARQKQVIRDSRIESTRLIVEAVGTLAPAARPQALVSASGIDYYPPVAGEFDDDDDITEDAKPGDSFLARVCRDWEREATVAEKHGLRVARLRIGAVFGRGGGALEKIVPTFKAFVGGSLGSGKQWFSWVHLDDVIGVFLAATKDPRFTGAFNVVAPEPVRYREVAKAIGQTVHRPSFWRVPGFALKIAVGEFAESLLSGRKAVPTRLTALEYKWVHPHLAPAIAASI